MPKNKKPADEMDIQSADEIRLIETDDGERWANLKDLIMVAEFTRETLDHEAEGELANAGTYENQQEIQSVKDIQDRFIDSIVEALEDMQAE